MYEENLLLQADEVEALSAIYGQDWTTVSQTGKSYNVSMNRHDKTRELNLQTLAAEDKPIPQTYDNWPQTNTREMRLRVTLPWVYPISGPPLYQLNAPWLRTAEKLQLAEALEDIYCNHMGESILYLWIEKVKEFIQNREETSCGTEHDDDLEPANTVLERVFTSTIVEELPEIFHGEPVTHKKSTFQAHLASIVISDQVPKLLNKLKEDRKVGNATHNMYAYRIFNTDKGTTIQDCDDDGENHAGSRLLHLLQILDANNVLVVVSRWYGGVQLGPDRFRHINNCAREILLTNGLIKASTIDSAKKS